MFTVHDSFELANTLRNASNISQNQNTSTVVNLQLHDWVIYNSLKLLLLLKILFDVSLLFLLKWVSTQPVG